MAAVAATLFLTHARLLPYPSLHCTHPSSSSPSLGLSLSRSQSPLLTLLIPSRFRRTPRVFAVAENERKVILSGSDLEDEEKAIDDGVGASDETKRRLRPCELYVCNLPRSYDISHLLELFKPYGTVQSVEVSRDPETGISRGCGFVTMGSISEAKYAIAALDGSDIAGREMRVKFSVDMVSGRKNVEALNSAPKKNFVFESPYKIYVGNLSWSTRPQDLREHFSQFGTVVSTRVLHDRKRGKNRVYAFLSFSSPDEVKVATEADGSEFYGRVMLVRQVINEAA
ncbi:hypothetical protein M5K25_025474 [Dendrobium thyrsiflorum]|uniref:RRM domain-containing protein n=1 Tax=Dendrobium thyrsiflorum TaxID=117978 RepID=A0ABD0U4F5_DENTH